MHKVFLHLIPFICSTYIVVLAWGGKGKEGDQQNEIMKKVIEFFIILYGWF